MNKIETEVDLFIEKYNFFVSLRAIKGLSDLSTLHDIFVDWLYFMLVELEENGYIKLLQYDINDVEFEYPRFIDNFSGKEYDLHGYTYLVEDTFEYEH